MEKQNECRICGHKWLKRVSIPKACPNCKRYDWEIKKEVIEDKTENETTI